MGRRGIINTLGQVLQNMVTDSRVVRPHLESMSWDADKIQRLQNDVAAMLQYRQFIGHLDRMPSAEEMIFAVGCTERALHGMACTLDQVALELQENLAQECAQAVLELQTKKYQAKDLYNKVGADGRGAYFLSSEKMHIRLVLQTGLTSV